MPRAKNIIVEAERIKVSDDPRIRYRSRAMELRPSAPTTNIGVACARLSYEPWHVRVRDGRANYTYWNGASGGRRTFLWNSEFQPNENFLGAQIRSETCDARLLQTRRLSAERRDLLAEGATHL
jgi:hypothetical protein